MYIEILGSICVSIMNFMTRGERMKIGKMIRITINGVLGVFIGIIAIWWTVATIIDSVTPLTLYIIPLYCMSFVCFGMLDSELHNGGNDE